MNTTVKTVSGVLWLCLLAAQTIFTVKPTTASGLFSYPYKGYFTWQAPALDPWYLDKDGDLPDKWEHYMINYAAAQLFKERIGTTRTALLLGTAGILKEYGDGWREGFSLRDLGMNALGAAAGLLNEKLLCRLDAPQKKIFLVYYLKTRW